MGVITLTKKVKAATTTPLSKASDEIDTFGRLAAEAAPILAEIKQLTAKLKPYKDAEKRLAEALSELLLDDDVEGYTQRGALYQVEIGPKGSKREVTDIQGVRKLLGDDVFFKLCKINLKDVDDYLCPEERDEVIKVIRTTHSFQVTPRS